MAKYDGLLLECVVLRTVVQRNWKIGYISKKSTVIKLIIILCEIFRYKP